MLLDGFSGLNWLAVVVAAALYYVLGAIWFAAPVLGNPWMRSMGVDPANPPSPNPVTLVLPVVFYLVAAVAMGLLVEALAYTSLTDGLILGLVVGIGFAVTVLGVTANFETTRPQPWTWWVIDGAYHLIGIVIMAVVLAIWQ